MALAFRIQPGEEWSRFDFGNNSTLQYAVSNHGRIVSYTDKMENGRILKGSVVEGFRVIRFKKVIDGKVRNGHKFLHKLVAETFLKPQSPEHQHVVHIDHNKLNNYVSNLKWMTRQERLDHIRKSPAVIKAKAKLVEFNKARDGHKLTTTQVIRIKKKLFDPKRKTRLKLLAKQFNITEMQLYRIKTGENWGHVKVPGLDTTYVPKKRAAKGEADTEKALKNEKAKDNSNPKKAPKRVENKSTEIQAEGKNKSAVHKKQMSLDF